MTTENTQIECHECGRWLTVEIDLALEGNHVVVCPCGHEHYRVVKAGKVTDIRWAQRNSQAPVPIGADKSQWIRGQQAPQPSPQAQASWQMRTTFISWTSSTGGTANTASSSTANYFIYTSWASSTS